MPADRAVSQHLQDCIVRLAVTSPTFLAAVRPQLDPDVLSSDVAQVCLRICFAFYDKFRTAPGDHFHDELVRCLAGVDPNRRQLFAAYEARLSELSEPSISYALDRTNDLIRHRTLSVAAVEFARKVDAGKYAEAEALMLTALRAGLPDRNVGVDYLQSVENRVLLRQMSEPHLCKTGFDHMDEYIGGLRRQQLVVILGGYKGCKTWTGQRILATAFRYGLKCLHISHEMSASEIEDRYDMMFGCLVSSRTGENADFVTLDEITGRETWFQQYRPSIYEAEIVRAKMRTLRRLGGKLMIRKFAGRTCSALDIDALLDRLESQCGFIPDVVLNDYPDIMKPVNEREEPRDRINTTYLHLKRIADERDLVMVAPSQANRSAITAERPSINQFAEDIRKAAHCDIAFAVCRTRAQKPRRMGTFYCILNRSGPMDVSCNFWYNLCVGQFPLLTAPVRSSGDDANPEDET